MGEAQVALQMMHMLVIGTLLDWHFEGSELAVMRKLVAYLADDMYYEFLGFRRQFPTLGTLGGHLIYLNLGEQVRMDEHAQYQGTFPI